MIHHMLFPLSFFHEYVRLYHIIPYYTISFDTSIIPSQPFLKIAIQLSALIDG